jgi:DNA repair protein RadC
MKSIDKIEDIKRLNNQELLSLLFPSKIRRSDLKKLTRSFETFRELFFADADRIKTIEKVDHRSIRTLSCMREIIERVASEKLTERPIIKSLDAVVGYCKTTMSTLSVECLKVLFLNGQNMLISELYEEYGCVSSVAIYVRSIIKKALNLEASAIILVHNHPSGSPKPSVSDMTLTKQLVNATKELDIKLLDHIIIGGNEYFSMKEHKMIRSFV